MPQYSNARRHLVSENLIFCGDERDKWVGLALVIPTPGRDTAWK